MTTQSQPDASSRFPAASSVSSLHVQGFSGVAVSNEKTPRHPALGKLSKKDDLTAKQVVSLLSPLQTDVSRIFQQGYATWSALLDLGRSVPFGSLPDGLGPSAMLQDAPSLPPGIPGKGILAGSPVWHLIDASSSDVKDDSNTTDPNFAMNTLIGPPKYFRLFYNNALRCNISADPASCHYGKPASAMMGTSKGPPSLAITTMAWSYIFSVRLLEYQGLNIRYTRDALQPRLVRSPADICEDEIAVCLSRRASPRLIRWLCTILAPMPGWEIDTDEDDKRYPPWAASCFGGLRVIVTIDTKYNHDPTELPPSSLEAMELLIELSSLYGLELTTENQSGSCALAPTLAGFYAALAIPFYRAARLYPVFPPPFLDLEPYAETDPTAFWTIRQCYADVDYFLTISIHPHTIGSVLWSIFWQPEIDCNLVSPWFASIVMALRLVIEARDLELLSRVFIARRPRVGLWWLGVCLLGSPQVFHLIERYLRMLDEGCSYNSFACSDMVAAQWTGVAQSYLDRNCSRIYDFSRDDAVEREDVFRLRNALMLRDPYPLSHAWRPFGQMQKSDVELQLWPYLQSNSTLEYKSWIWWLSPYEGGTNVCSDGFRSDTEGFQPDIPDNVDMCQIPDEVPLVEMPEDIPLAPSIEATRQMLAHGFLNTSGERSLLNAGFDANVMQHDWIKDWLTPENACPDYEL